ncbi:MAG TPA: ABC transporter permease [Longimicrobiales bacterium]|nr:ABC transporter permease [Longimicrobiales bacterium]
MSPSGWPERVFGLALLLLPRRLRRTHGGAMQAAFRDRLTHARDEGGPVTPVVLAEVVDLALTAVRVRVGRTGGASHASNPRRPPPASLRGAARGGVGLGELGTDLGVAARTLRRRPGYLGLAAGTLALGVGACAAMFAVVNGVLLRPLAYPEADRLVMVFQTLPQLGWNEGPLSFPTYDALERDADTFASLGGATGLSAVLLDRGDPRRVEGQRVTGGLFRTLGVDPALGRWILPEDDTPTSAPVAVLSDGLWTEVFGRDPDVVGSTIRLGDTEHTVVGVMPRDFPSIGQDDDLWTSTGPLRAAADPVNLLRGIGRLAPGTTLAAARSQVEALAAGLPRTGPDTDERQAWLVSRHDYVVGGFREQLLLLMGAVLLVAVVSCANVAALTLTRGTHRREELAVRSALGAGRARLVRALLSESAVVATLGGLAGAGLAWLLVRGVVAFGPADLPRREALGLDGTALLFVVGMSVLCALAFGGVPAVRASRSTPAEELKGRGAGRTPSLRPQAILAVVQVALAAFLLVGAGLLGRSLARLQAVDPGFDTADRLTALVPVPEGAPEERLAFLTALEERIAAHPAVRSVGLSWGLPFASGEALTRAMPEGPVLPPTERVETLVTPVTGDFFRAMGMPLVAGSGLQGIGPDDPPAAVINQALADALWPGQDPVGRRLYRGGGDEPTLTRVVGVVPTVRTASLADEGQPYLYQAFPQALWADRVFVVAHTTGDPLAVVPALRAIVTDLNPRLPVDAVSTLDGRVASSLARPRFRTALAGGFALLGAVLALVGVYGVMALWVASRTREIGVRMAMGAPARRIRRTVLLQGLTVAVVGLAVGLVGAAVTGGLMESFLYGVPRVDAPTYLGVAAGIGTAVVLAVLPSARRASSVDPLHALRSE